MKRSTVLQLFSAVVLATVGSHSFLSSSATPSEEHSQSTGDSKTDSHNGPKKTKGSGSIPRDQATAEPEHGGYEGPWLATAAYFGNEPPEWGKPTQEEIQRAPDYLWTHYFRVTPRPSESLHSMIVTVADPLHSHLALTTDRVLTSLYQAMNSQGWDFAGQWLPWPSSEQDAHRNDDVSEEVTYRAEIRTEQPGLLLFRKRDDVAFIFIVGETPTTGVDKLQFQNAVAYAKCLRASPSGAKELVSVLSPSFSGSLASLKDLIQQASQAGTNFRLENESATRSDLNGLDGQLPMTWANKDEAFIDGKLWSGSRGNRRIAKLGLAEKDVVTIAEAGTAYGEVSSGTKYFFPREISSLRNAYSDAPAKSSQADGTAPVSLSLKDDKDVGDAIPTYADGHFAQSEYAELLELADHLHHEHTQLAGLYATNPLDTLFLVRLLRQQLPDTRLLVRDADLMLPQTAARDNLTGTLVLTVSAGPLDLRATDHGRGRVNEIWPDTVAEWAYFGCVDMVAGWGKGQPDRGIHGLWLMAVTPHGYAPIARYSESGDGTHDPRIWPRPSRFWNVAVFLLSFVALLLAGGSVMPEDCKAAPWNRFGIARVDENKAARMFYLAAIHINVAGMLFLVLFPATGLTFEDEPFVKGVGAVGAVAFVAIGLTSIRLFLQQWKCVFEGRKGWGAIVKNSFFWALLLLALGAVPLSWLVCCTRIENLEGALFRYRTLHLFVGASPALPVLSLVAGFTFIYYMHLTRVASTDGPRMMFPVNALDAKAQYKFSRNSQLLLDMCRAVGFVARPGTRWLIGTGLSLYLACALIAQPAQFLGSMEGAWFTWPFTLLFVLYVLTMLFACLRFSQGWHLLREMLEAMAAMPVGAGFERFQNVIGTSAVWTQIRRVRSVETVKASLPFVEEIARQDGCKGLDGLCVAYKDAAEFLLEVDELPQKRTEAIEAVHLAARRLCDGLVEQRLQHRKAPEKPRQEAVAAEERESATKPVPIPPDPECDFVLLQLIAYIRVCLLQLRNLTYLLVGAFMFLVLSLNSYAIQAPLMMGRFLFVMFLLLGVVIFKVTASMQRNRVLSLLSAGISGKLDLDFYLKIVSVGVLPLIGLLSALFPSVSGVLFKWVQPGIEALR